MTNRQYQRLENLLRGVCFGLLGFASTFSHSLVADDAISKRPNVVLIVCDDLNDYVEGYGGHPQAQTPNMKRLANSGVSFHCAHSNNPVCAPSRSSFLTGIYGHTSGNLFWAKWFQNPVLKNSKTMMDFFRENGYHVAGSGKLMHHGRPAEWDEFKHAADYGPHVFDGSERVAHPSVPLPFGLIGAVDGSFAPLSDIPFAKDDDPSSGWIYGNWRRRTPFRYRGPADRDPTPDERNASWAAGKLKELGKVSGRPFFLGVGFIRPHTPLHVPKKYFDLFPLSEVQLPLVNPGDEKDTHFAEVISEDHKGLRYYRDLTASYATAEEGLRRFTQAYLAAVASVDDCIGTVLDAIDNNPDPSIRDNTIVILTSDHGWNMGEKQFLFKNSPWEESTRVPLIIRAPGVARAGSVCHRAVSLIDLYPTLTDLCDLEGDTRKNDQGAPLDGYSLKPLMVDPDRGEWEGPAAALSMIFIGKSPATIDLPQDVFWSPRSQNWSIRSSDWRYIRYRDGQEELYDHRIDPNEWANLASDPVHLETLSRLRKQLFQRVPELED